MRKIAIIFLFFSALFSVEKVYSAAFNSTQDGSWSSASTWGGSGVPGNGDTVAIEHNVTVDVNVTVGHSPGTDHAAAAIEVNDGHLALSAGVTLICRGDLWLRPGYMTMDAGAVLEMDSSQAGAPFTSVYKIDIRPDYGNNNALLTVNGTSAAHCEIRANASGAHTRITDGNSTSNGGRMIADFCDFKRLGGNPDYQAWYYDPSGTGDLFSVRDCTFDECSRVSARGSTPAGSHVEFIRCTWTNSVDNPGGNDFWEIFSAGADYGAVTRLIQCSFDKIIYLGRARDYEIEDCVFQEGIKSYSGDYNSGVMRSFKRNFVRWLSASGRWTLNFGNTVEDCVFIKDLEDFNPHYVSMRSGTGQTVIRNNIVWFTGQTYNNAEGDGWMFGAPGSGTREENAVIIEKNIFLPNGQGPDGYNNLSCTPFTILFQGSSYFHVIYRRNTAFVGSSAGGCNIGETNPAYAGDVAYFKSNLFIGTDRGSGNYAGRKIASLGYAQTDAVLAQDADYNAGYLLINGSHYGNGSGKGYVGLSFSGDDVIGAHDIDDVDPQLVDDTRTPVSWDAHLGGPGSMQGTMARLAPGAGHTMQDLLDYIREGFRPQNAVLQGAGDPADGSPDIGAVDMSAPVIDAPAGLSAAAVSQTQIDLVWDDNSDNEQGFRIEQSLTPDLSDFTEIGTTGAGINTHSVTSLDPGTPYYFRVRAYNAGDYSAYSNIDSAVTAALVIDAPTDLSASVVSQNQINLSWTHNADNNEGYRVERSVNTNDNFQVIASLGAEAEAYNDTTVSSGITYYYRAVAYQGASDSDPSNEASAVTPGIVIQPVSDFISTDLSQTRITLHWQDNADNEDGYYLERSSMTNTNYHLIAVLTPNTETYPDTNLVPDTTYYYRLTAYQGSSDTSLPVEMSVVTPSVPVDPDPLQPESDDPPPSTDTTDSRLKTGDIRILGSEQGKGTINPDKGETARIYFRGNNTGEYKCMIFTLNGELVWESIKNGASADYFEWIPSHIASGAYIAYIKGPGLSKKKKIVIIR